MTDQATDNPVDRPGAVDTLCNGKVVAWALYDWGNSAFATVVMAGFFPLFYKEFWAANVEAGTSTFQLGVANSFASAVVVILAPILGAIADSANSKKRFLVVFALLGVSMTAALYFVAWGQWFMALLMFVLATIGFSAANIFYDSLIVNVAPRNRLDLVSAYGFALGYLGGGVLFALCVAMKVWPQFFGFHSGQDAVQFGFLLTAIWWLVFSLPLLIRVPEPGHADGVGLRHAVGKGFSQLKNTFARIRHLRVVFLFLLAYWLYIDGVDTIVRMAIDYGMALKFDSTQLVTALLITQFVGFPAAIAFGFLGQRIGAKQGILIGIAVYVLVTLWAAFMENVSEFYILAVTIGLVQGGVQSLSRSFYARIIPASKSAEYFGFYNMLGKFAAILGPLMMGVVSFFTGSPRLSLLSILILFIGGALLLLRVDVAEGERMAQELDRELS
ncbi:MAG TPA: MFS transporter [Gammaproteobacteria bacterium]|nr:MFS transporter [Gammaproteobacteria bacterium]